MKPIELLKLIDDFYLLVEKVGSSNSDGKQIRQTREEIFTGFKQVKFETNSERQNAWTRFQDIIQTLRDRQFAVKEENKQFAAEADSKISRLEKSYNDDFFRRKLTKDEFKEIKSELSNTFKFINQYNWPSKEEKSSAFERFNLFRDKISEEENKYYSNIRETIAKRLQHSEETTAKILRAINACHPDADGDEIVNFFGELILHLVLIGFLMDFAEWLTGPIKKENPLKIKSQGLKDIRKFINDNKDDITREDKHKIYARLDIIQADLNTAWDDHKKELQQKKQEWERKQVERQQKQTEWQRKQKEWTQKLEERLENQISYVDKQRNNLANNREFIAKLQDRLNNQEVFLKKVESRIEDLEEQYRTGRSDSFRERVSGWIANEESKKSQVEVSIEQLRDKISEVEKNIDAIVDKIQSIESDIQELKEKIREIREKLGE